MAHMPEIYVTHSLPYRIVLTGQERRPVYYPGTLRCPECGGPLTLDVNEWTHRTGKPTKGGVEVECAAWEDWVWDRELESEDEDGLDGDFGHRFWQSDWMSVLDVVTRWARVHLRRAS